MHEDPYDPFSSCDAVGYIRSGGTVFEGGFDDPYSYIACDIVGYYRAEAGERR